MKHKGYVSARDWMRRQTLVRQGKAMWWIPLRNIEDALKAAGLV